MNTEDSQDKTVSMTTGQRLRQAREQLGLSQQAVAERLCLKMSTVRDIEDDNMSADSGFNVRAWLYPFLCQAGAFARR